VGVIRIGNRTEPFGTHGSFEGFLHSVLARSDPSRRVPCRISCRFLVGRLDDDINSTPYVLPMCENKSRRTSGLLIFQIAPSTK